MLNTISVVKKDGQETFYDDVINTYVQNGALLIIEPAQPKDVGSPRVVINIKIPLADIDRVLTFENRIKEDFASSN